MIIAQKAPASQATQARHRIRKRRGILPKPLLAILLLLSLSASTLSYVSAQDGATSKLPQGIDNKTPEAPKKKDEEKQPDITVHDSAPAHFTPAPPEPPKDEPKPEP